MTSLFPLPAEPANTNEDLAALFKKYNKYDIVYLNVHMRDDWIKVKQFFNDTWKDYEAFADPDFHTQLQTNFGSRSWELYLFNLLKSSGFNLTTQSKVVPNPDFKINLSDRNLYIEAVIAGKGDGNNRVETISDRLSRVPSGTIVTHGGHIDDSNHPKLRRILSALKEKLNNFNSKYKDIMGAKDYYVIAVNGGDIDGNMMSEGLILEAVMGINPALHLPRKTDGSFGPAFQTVRANISNSGGTNIIDIGIFNGPDYSEISGVMYFGRDVINSVLQDVKPEEIIFVHNPNVTSDKVIPLSVFSNLMQITISPTHWTRHPPSI